MTPQLRGFLAIVSAEAEQKIAQQQRHIQQLQAMGLPTLEAKKTMDVMLTVASAMRDDQLIIEGILSGTSKH